MPAAHATLHEGRINKMLTFQAGHRIGRAGFITHEYAGGKNSAERHASRDNTLLMSPRVSRFGYNMYEYGTTAGAYSNNRANSAALLNTTNRRDAATRLAPTAIGTVQRRPQRTYGSPLVTRRYATTVSRDAPLRIGFSYAQQLVVTNIASAASWIR